MTPILPTESERKAISNGDRETINRYYLVNYEFITMVCRDYSRNNLVSNSLWQDMAQECFLYFTAREIGEKLGININGVQSLKTGVSGYINRLRKHAEEFRNDLLNAGYEIVV